MTDPIALVPDLAGCPYAAYAELRADGGVHRATKQNGDPVWVISRYEDVKALLVDPRLSSNSRNALPGYTGFGLPPALDNHLLNVDASDHSRVSACSTRPSRFGESSGCERTTRRSPTGSWTRSLLAGRPTCWRTSRRRCRSR